MCIEVRNMARIELPKDQDLKAFVLGMFSYINASTGESFCNYYYKDGVCWLPPNMEKLKLIAELLGKKLVDCRSEGSPLKEPFLLQPGFELRGYQVEPAVLLEEHAKKFNYSTLMAGTGTGKTVVMTYVAGMLGGKSLVLVDQSNLIPSWSRAVDSIWGRKLQNIKAKDTEFADFAIATFQLLAKTDPILKLVSKEFKTLLVDESHISTATSYKKVLSALDTKYRLSCSASFFKKGFSTQILSDFLAPVSVTMVNPDAIKPEIRFIESGVQWVSGNPNDYASRILPSLADDMKRNSLIFALLKDCLRDKRITAVVCITKKQAALLHALMERSGARSIMYVGTVTEKRDREISALIDDGKIDLICCCSKLQKGLDWPRLDCMVVCKPDNSERNAIQVVGRTTRYVEGKPTPIVYDIKDLGTLAEVFARNRGRYYAKEGYKILN